MTWASGRERNMPGRSRDHDEDGEDEDGDEDEDEDGGGGGRGGRGGGAGHFTAPLRRFSLDIHVVGQDL